MALPEEEQPKTLHFFEDLQVGQIFRSGTHQVDAEEIKAFASQFDPQPFHLDEKAAEQSMFQGLVASGWHTAAVSMRLWVEGSWPMAGGLIGAGGEISWLKPVRPGDILHVEGEILELRSSRSNRQRGIVTVRNKTINQRDEVVQIMTAKIVVPCRSQEPGSTSAS